MVWDEGRGFLDTQAAADILAWENSEFSIVASGRIARVRYVLPPHSVRQRAHAGTSKHVHAARREWRLESLTV